LEDEVLGILGPYDPGRYHNPAAVTISELFQPEEPAAEATPSLPQKSCHRCHQEVPVGVHICPHCRAYIAGLSDFSST
jgi:hypothetical protein